VSFIPATGALSGTPAAGTNGTYPITLTAQNGVGLTATESIILTVSQSQAAAITSTNNTTFVVGTAGSFPVTVTGTPAPILSESGTLPTGVTFTPATGALAGTPALGISGTYPITIIAQNGVTPAATQSFTLTVNQAAAITSANNTTFLVGTAGTFTVTATGTPAATLSEAGPLPAGVSFTVATGMLAGSPAPGTNGSYPITFTAQNSVGAPTVQSFTLTVGQLQSVCTPLYPPSGTYLNDLNFSTFNVDANLTHTLNAVQSPDCTTSAASYIETTGSGQHAATESYTGPVQNGAAITGTIYVASVSGSRFIDLGIYDQSFVHYGGVLGINPTACTASQPAFSDSGANHWILPVTPLKLTQVTLGGVVWCQIQFSVIPQSSASGLNFFLNYDASSAGADASFSGDGTSGMMFWGASI
jgi:hypothetical protein